MLKMVMEKPMQVTIVMAVPFEAGGAFCATILEKTGESAITTNPQNIRKAMNAGKGQLNASGDSTQQQPDNSNAANAVAGLPYFCERNPLAIQAKLPGAMTRKEYTGTLILCWG